MEVKMRVLGIDLAWGEPGGSKLANETGVVAVDEHGHILDGDWTCGIDETAGWMEHWAVDDTLAMIDAPLVVGNLTGQRLCERQVGQRYGRWKVSANSTNINSARKAGVTLLERLEHQGWRYDNGCTGPPSRGRVVSEVYPYTTIVGAEEFGYENERPRYKRKPRGMTIADFRPIRAQACDLLIGRLASLRDADPVIDLLSNAETAGLVHNSSPQDNDRRYKHREDLIDALICAWTGLLWLRWGFDRCQVLGAEDPTIPRATIVAPRRISESADTE
jgi:predicted RNase H-like nuclease